MQPERDFFDFALKLASIQSMRDQIHFIQIGDSFDLWVNCPEWTEGSKRAPAFVPDDKARRVLLAENALSDVPKWVYRIQGLDPDGQPGAGTNWVFSQLTAENPTSAELDKMPNDLHTLLVNRANEFSTPEWKQYVIAGPRVWRNPVDGGFRLLEDTFGSNLTYIYGNHDDFLAHAEVCEAAGLRPRKPWDEFPGIFIEHGHRMEIPEVVSHPIGGYNSDGMCLDAWESTNTVYDHSSGSDSFSPKGWLEDNLRLPDRVLPLFTNSWLKLAGLVLILPVEAVASGFKWALSKLNITGDLPLNLPADISFAAWFDQPWYIQEYAKVWVGRNSDAAGKQLLPPHIFVIGHTHLPLLAHLHIVRDTPARRRPKRLS
jgi:hypothetical protein